MKELGMRKRNKRIRVTFCAYREWALIAVKSVADKCDIDVVDIIKNEDEYKEKVLSYIDGYVDCIVLVGWSWIIKDDTLKRFLCVGMHPSDLPMYRGGSPIQHQIIDGLDKTKISLITISPDGIDVGDIWCKEDWEITGNSMSIILNKLAESTAKLLYVFFDKFDNLIPEKQNLEQGSYYKRRQPIESLVTWKQLEEMGLKRTYNLIRALGDPYPNVYIEDDEGNVLKLKNVEYVEAGTRKDAN